MFDFLLSLLGSVLQGGTDFDVPATDRQSIRHALRISRKRRPLSPQQHAFATAWLQYGIDHMKELGMESKEVQLRVGLLRVKHARVVLRMADGQS